MADVAVANPVDITPGENVEEQKVVEKSEVNELKQAMQAGGDVIPVSPMMTSIKKDGASGDLAETVQQQAERIKELEMSLTDARKIIDNREKLLAALQWKPKEDYYAWKNPQITDKTVRDTQERKIRTLLEQMRVMEKLLAERDQVLNSMVLAGSNNSLAQSGGSPFSSPMGSRASPAAQPSWGRSPTASPALTSQAPSSDRKALSSSWWFFKKGSTALDPSLKSSQGTGSPAMRPSNAFANSDSAPPSPAVRAV